MDAVACVSGEGVLRGPAGLQLLRALLNAGSDLTA